MGVKWGESCWIYSKDMSVFETGNMQYRRYGNSGLKISVVSLGNMINSKPENY